MYPAHVLFSPLSSAVEVLKLGPFRVPVSDLIPIIAARAAVLHCHAIGGNYGIRTLNEETLVTINTLVWGV